MKGTIVYLKTSENRVEVPAKNMILFKIQPRI